MRLIDLTGQRFGRLVVIKRAENSKAGKSKWLCECDCGNVTVVFGCCLKSGNTKSCGCLHKESITTHGYSGNNRKNSYKVWAQMLQRCNNSKSDSYKYYGARGIKICERWAKFTSFLEDMGERPKGLTLDRINNSGNYEPNNCRWATYRQQRRNNRRPPILNEAKVHIIKKLLELGLKQIKIAKMFKVKCSAIQDIKRGHSWVDVK